MAAPRSVHRARRRPMAAGHAVVAAAIALGVATLLNAGALLDTAEGLEYGTRRSVALTVMRPVHSVAEFLRLTAPRDRLDRALGKGERGAEDDPFGDFTSPSVPPSSVTPTTGDVSPTSTTAPARPAPTPDDPLRLWVAGDSLAFEYGKAVIRAADGSELLTVVAPTDYEVATGLARPDRFNWPAELDAGMEEHDPDVVIFMVGSNDDQGVTDPSGTEHRCCDSEGWQEEYGRRAGSVMDQVNAQGRVLVFVGVPIMGGDTGSRNPRYRVVNRVIREQAEARPNSHYLDSYELFQDDDGEYARFVDGVKLRADDDVHLERAGGDRLASATIDLLGRVFDLGPTATTTTTTTTTVTTTTTAATTTTTTPGPSASSAG